MAAHLDLTPIAFLLFSAMLGGLALAGMRQPPLVGYIVVGALLGPSGLGLITDRDTVAVLAEAGVLVLLFVIGMQLSLRAFKSIWRTAVGTVALQIAASVGIMLVVGHVLDWPVGRSILLGFVLALSSTAVGVKMLEDIGELRQETGRCVVGVLIAQDLAVVPMLIVVGGLASGEGLAFFDVGLKLLLATGALAGLIWFLSRRQRLHLPFRRLVIRYPDLAPVAALTICLAGAALSGALELSSGLGAFLAGLYIGNTTERALMVRATEPIQSLLLMVFFLSIGLLIDLPFVLEHAGTIAVLVAIVFVFNTAINVAALRVVGEPWRLAFTAGFALAQIGEFSFLLSDVGEKQGLIGDVASRLVIAVIALSMIASPLWLELARRLHALRAAPPAPLRSLVGRLARDEARLLRLRSRRAVKGSTAIASEFGERIDRVLRRERKAEPPAPEAPDRPVSR